jgi:hypothetical protein
MTQPLILAFVIIAVTIVVQMTSIRYLLRFLAKSYRDNEALKGYWREVSKLSMSMLILVAGHVIQIAIWAILFRRLGEFDNFSFAFYHSAVNFTSLGYGDHVMSETWRVLGPLEAVDGILMFGLSAAVFFAVLTKIFSRYTKNPGGRHRQSEP